MVLDERTGKPVRLRERLRAMKNAAEVVSTAWCVAVTWRELGHRPTQAEVAQSWHTELRTVQRDFKRWAQVFTNAEVFEGNQLDIYTVAERMVLDHGASLERDQPQAALSLPADIAAAT
jgi:hypothetical protein